MSCLINIFLHNFNNNNNNFARSKWNHVTHFFPHFTYEKKAKTFSFRKHGRDEISLSFFTSSCSFFPQFSHLLIFSSLNIEWRKVINCRTLLNSISKREREKRRSFYSEKHSLCVCVKKVCIQRQKRLCILA